jgi:hypothetical protein
MDATFWGRGYGKLIARAEGKNIFHLPIQTEKISEYRTLLASLSGADCTFAGFVIDGRRGVRILLLEQFPQVPLQLCQFHQIQIVRRYLTSRPKLEAGKQLLKITRDMKHCGLHRFRRKLLRWRRRWGDFLVETTNNVDQKGWHYTHKKLSSAHRSLTTNLPWLFTYLRYPERKMPNTTNSCDGSFAHLKQKVGLHRGLRKHRREKMVNYFLEKGVK